MKSNIFNALGWFEKRKCEPQCNCKTFKEMRVEYAVKISEPEAIERLLNGRKIEFEKEYTCGRDGLYSYPGLRYRFKIKAVEIFVNTTDDCDFYKLACLACNTCLGWSHAFNYMHSSSVTPNKHFNIIIGTPNEHFNTIIENKIVEKKKDIEQAAVLEKKRIEKKRLAKEICGEI